MKSIDTEQFDQRASSFVRLRKQADKFIRDRRFQAAFDAAVSDPELRNQLINETEPVLEKFGIPLPKGLEIKFLAKPHLNRPTPDFHWFSIRMFGCRTYWIKHPKSSEVETVEVCLGFEITPQSLPGGPIA